MSSGQHTPAAGDHGFVDRYGMPHNNEYSLRVANMSAAGRTRQRQGRLGSVRKPSPACGMRNEPGVMAHSERRRTRTPCSLFAACFPPVAVVFEPQIPFDRWFIYFSLLCFVHSREELRRGRQKKPFYVNMLLLLLRFIVERKVSWHPDKQVSTCSLWGSLGPSGGACWRITSVKKRDFESHAVKVMSRIPRSTNSFAGYGDPCQTRRYVHFPSQLSSGRDLCSSDHKHGSLGGRIVSSKKNSLLTPRLLLLHMGVCDS